MANVSLINGHIDDDIEKNEVQKFNEIIHNLKIEKDRLADKIDDLQKYIVKQKHTKNNEKVSKEEKQETSLKCDENTVSINNKLIKLIDLIQTSINCPRTDVIYNLDLFKDELQEENYCIKCDNKTI